MTADQQLARWGISAVAHRGQVVVTMNADLLTFTAEDWNRWLMWAGRALYDAQHEEKAA